MRRLIQLSYFACAVVLLCVARVGLAIAPATLVRWSECLVQLGGGDAPPRSVLISLRKAAALLPGQSCLSRALAGQWLLFALGSKSELRVGVNWRQDFRAHAWLICGSEVVLGAFSHTDGFRELRRS